MAEGVLPTLANSKMMREVVLDPFPKGKARIFPDMDWPNSS
jgi:hypothetical protein